MTVHLEKRDPARNQSRFYRIEIQPTLFGEWAVIREWGRIGFRGGQRREHWHSTAEAAVAELQTMRYAKEKRGYQAASYRDPQSFCFLKRIDQLSFING